MPRFLTGLLLGASAAGITWAATENPTWTAIAGTAIAALVWFGHLIIDALDDLL